MSWTTAGDLKAQLQRRWERGDLLRTLISGETLFPLRLSLSVPASSELAAQFAAVRAWIGGLSALPQVRIEWREFRHAVLGAQRLPQSAWIDSLEQAVALLGKRRELTGFSELLALTHERQPALLAWLGKRPLQALALAGQWPLLLDVVAWLQAHPRPGVYLRQVDLPGIHSKFIESQRGVLSELFDAVLPPEAIESGHSGVSQFAARYGFLDKPARIRFRVLDPRLAIVPGATLPDITLDAASFAKLDAPTRLVFITENETNFLAFPEVAQAIVIFGAGYGWDTLGQAEWLKRCAIHYWGDIDTHGFAILDQLRSRYPHVTSFLMDRTTLMAHEALWGKEADQVSHDLLRLTATEKALFDELRDKRIQPGLRLEQEHVGYRSVTAALQAIAGDSLPRPDA
ncbi:MAG: hypothetical protein HYZ65_05725 [Burkholderiales bacterium]|nr:hypothetical protein [Burkholderiales bacterium]